MWQPRWYLIIDNVDTEAAALEVQAQLDHLTTGHVVITSRLSDWQAGVETLDLSVLDEADAIDFLHERTDARRPKAATDEADVRTLALKLDGLALALEQAGAYIAERRVNFEKYLADWETRRQKVLAWHNEVTMSYPKSVAITWQTSFDEISDDARRLLTLLAELAPDPIPRGIIEDGDDSGDLEDAFVELDRYLLVRVLEEPPDTFTVHRLVQEIVRGFSVSGLKFQTSDGTSEVSVAKSAQPESSDLKLNTENITLRREAPPWLQAAKLLKKWAPIGGQDISTWEAWTLLDPHLERLFEQSAAHDDPGPDPAPVLGLLSGFAQFQQFRNGAYALAESLKRRALPANERNLGPEHPLTLTSLNDLAAVYQRSV